MTTVPPGEQVYVDALRTLREHGIAFVVIGSFGLRLHLGERLEGVTGRPPADCDIVVPGDRATLLGFVEALPEWRVWSWRDPVPPLPEDIAGRFYLRARRGGLILDATYEPLGVTWPELRDTAIERTGIPVATIESIVKTLAVRGGERDRRIIDRLRDLEP
ncbi:hypothetical protein [Actinomadura sp. 9N407]|uniref:hypothetical protein n=1 Tax=Actinomadura sp. 9N407 TaxID=3375154 RepID=UPI0037B1CCC8